MKKKTRLYIAIAGGTIFLGLISCLLAFRKNKEEKRQGLEAAQSDNDFGDWNEDNELSETSYEPVSSWLL